MTTRVLGINSAHNASVCLVENGSVKVAILEERLTRRKHQDGYPREAIKYCLQSANLDSASELDCIVINRYPDQGRFPHEDDYCVCSRCRPATIVNPSHHLLHAYTAWIASGFSSTVILVADGSGYSYGEYVRRGSPLLGEPPQYSEMEEAYSLYWCDDSVIDLIQKSWGLWVERSQCRYRFPSLGHVFSAVSQYIFGHWTHAGKTMGLAPYGDPNALNFRIVNTTSGDLQIYTDWIVKLPRQPKAQEVRHEEIAFFRNLAAKVQAELEDAVLFLANKLHTATRARNLCVSGGVGLNSVANGRLLRDGSFERVFVPAAPDDGGTAVGAAFYGHHQTTRHLPIGCDDNFYGRDYSRNEIRFALDSLRGLSYRACPRPAESAAQDIAEGQIVGWFEGRSEFGPRALGHRSILADPRDSLVRDRLNATVKFREPFRPFAASVLEEHVSRFFDFSSESPFMSFVAPIRASRCSEIPAVCHVDQTCRVQTVGRDFPGEFRPLLESFLGLTTIPLVLNTSFNVRGEPIVESPEDALTCFVSSGLEVLYLGPFRVEKTSLPSDPKVAAFFVPLLNPGLSRSLQATAADGSWGKDAHSAISRTGHQIPLTADAWNLLSLIDGKRNLGQIADLLRSSVESPELPFWQTIAWVLERGLIRLAPPESLP